MFSNSNSKDYSMKVFASLLFLLISCLNFSAQTARDSLELALEKVAQKEILPGFASVIIRDNEVKYTNAFGYADVNKKRPYTTQSLQNIASISKTFIGVALMKAEELELLDLDDAINNYIDFEIVNPRYPDEIITIRHLATHTSSFKDPEDYERAYIFQEPIEIDLKKIPRDWRSMVKLYNSNVPGTLENFIKSIYVKGGKYYRKANFSKKKPGTEFNYSNIGAGLASRIIEKASGKSFEAFTQEYIFDPIGMNSTSWNINAVDIEQKVTPYLTREISIPHYYLITFADGGLITNVEDLALFIIEMMKCFKGDGSILRKDKCVEMMTPYLKGEKDKKYGIFWEISQSGLSIGHNGGDPGTVTNMYFMPSTGVAKILFCNMIPYNEETGKAFGDVWNAMKQFQMRI